MSESLKPLRDPDQMLRKVLHDWGKDDRRYHVDKLPGRIGTGPFGEVLANLGGPKLRAVA